MYIEPYYPPKPYPWNPAPQILPQITSVEWHIYSPQKSKEERILDEMEASEDKDISALAKKKRKENLTKRIEEMKKEIADLEKKIKE